MVALPQPNTHPAPNLSAPFAHLWGMAMADDTIAAAYAMYYFHPMINDYSVLDEYHILPMAAYHCLDAGFTNVYADFVRLSREGANWDAIDRTITDTINPSLPEEIIDAELLAFGSIPIPWHGFDWYDDPQDTYNHMRPGLQLLADAIGLTYWLDDNHTHAGFQTHGNAVELADSLYESGYPAVAAAVRWLVGATTSDMLNYGYVEAGESGREWPHLVDYQVWNQEQELCLAYIDYALLGVDFIESNDDFHAYLQYNALLRQYQNTWEEYCGQHHQDIPIREGFIWPQRDRAHAPEAPDDFDLLSFWNRS